MIDSVTGGTPPYVGMLTSNITGAITYLNLGPFGGEFVGACSGDYTVMVTDSGLCSSLLLPSGNNQAIVTSTLVLTDPQIIVTDNVDCFGDPFGEAFRPKLPTVELKSWTRRVPIMVWIFPGR